MAISDVNLGRGLTKQKMRPKDAAVKSNTLLQRIIKKGTWIEIDDNIFVLSKYIYLYVSTLGVKVRNMKMDFTTGDFFIQLSRYQTINNNM